jgi:hypothetical protein
MERLGRDAVGGASDDLREDHRRGLLRTVRYGVETRGGHCRKNQAVQPQRAYTLSDQRVISDSGCPPGLRSSGVCGGNATRCRPDPDEVLALPLEGSDRSFGGTSVPSFR